MLILKVTYLGYGYFWVAGSNATSSGWAFYHLDFLESILIVLPDRNSSSGLGTSQKGEGLRYCNVSHLITVCHCNIKAVDLLDIKELL